MSENELNFDRHFYLYAKGHYKETDMMTDLIKIQSIRTGVPVVSLRPIHVYITIVRLAYVHINHEGQFNQFMDWIARNIVEDVDSYNDFHVSAIMACISMLGLTKVVDIPFELGEADSTILPLKEGS